MHPANLARLRNVQVFAVCTLLAQILVLDVAGLRRNVHRMEGRKLELVDGERQPSRSCKQLDENGAKRTLKSEELVAWKYQRYMRDYLACVQGVDDEVGRLRKWLADEGLAENTVVIYTTDNGFFLGDNGMYDKRFMYET
jgi:arylsulfatase A-like enzyme